MIRTYINRHDLEYYLYAMVKAFMKDAKVLAPDTAEHNVPELDEPEDEDVLTVSIEKAKVSISVVAGLYLTKETSKVYMIDVNEAASDNDDAGEDADAKADGALKVFVQKVIYQFMVTYTGKELPWGNLTGIRPTKLYLSRLNEGKSRQQAIDELKELHMVSDEKSELGVSIAEREKAIIDGMTANNGYSIYIGIPFCPSTCLYCSFTSNPIFSYKDKVDAYLKSIREELLATREIMKGRVLDTVYIGGGTPTALSDKELDQLLSYVMECCDMSAVKEFTVEAGRADSITTEKFEVMRKYPVTRISINPQTMNDKTLKLIGRHHSAGDVVDAFMKARELGFDNINMDMILGLPGETIEDIQYTLDEIKKLSPDSLTVHSLAVKRASRLKQIMDENPLPVSMDFEKAMDMSIKAADEMGLNPYYLYRQKDMAGNLENTGFARDGKYGLYNIVMMEEVADIVAIGAGTVSKRIFPDGHIERCDTVKDIALYTSKIKEMIERKRLLFCD